MTKIEDEELEKILQRHKDLEVEVGNLENKYYNLMAHQRTIVKALIGNNKHNYITPVVDKTSIPQTNQNNFKLLILNQPSHVHPAGFGHSVPFLSNYINYKAFRIFYALPKHNHKNGFEIYTTSVFIKDKNYVFEIVDSYNNTWTDYEVFRREFDGILEMNLKSWLGL